jgi:tetratricopeptide (TPR) repeat protein
MWADAPGSWPPEARGLSPRHFYLALASGELWLARHETAEELARESLAFEGRDGAMRLVAGCAWESEAGAVRAEQRGGGEWDDGLLRRAEEQFRAALEEAPALLEARLRLGWVLVRRDRPEEARGHLEAVAEKPGHPGQRALAWLFLSAVHEASGDAEARVEACRQALRLAPDMQAAHVCVAHALEALAGDEGSRAVLRSLFRERGRSWTLRDPWSEYPYGPPRLRQRPFEALVKRLAAP